MRQTHQKSRSRGRSRKPQNPMSRNYESNGPDVKIRGNASHIAEKYSTLARDALSNGDTVMAENYLQHAEHYNRLIAAAQAQRAEEQQQAAANGRGPQPGIERPSTDDDDIDNETSGSEEVSAEAEAGEEQPREKRSTRARRTRKAPVASESNDANGDDDSRLNGHDGNGSRELNGKRGRKAKDSTVATEVITEDAAALPDSITGGSAMFDEA